MRQTKIKPISRKQAKKLSDWQKVCDLRRAKLILRYGYLPCECCMKRTMKGEGHHNDRDRNNNIFNNCRIVRPACHRVITDNNVRDVPDRLGGVKIPKEPSKHPAYLAGYGPGRSFSKDEQVGRAMGTK